MRVAASVVVFGLAVYASGCAHADSAADRHFAELQDAIGKDQVNQDRSNDGLGLLDVSPPDGKPAPAAKHDKSPPRTVSIGDDDDAHENDDPNDPNARPEIRLQGQGGGAARPVRGKTSRGRGEARIDPVDDGLHADAPRPAAFDPEAKKSYETALGLATSRQYERALEAFNAFLVRFPDHPYAENALYWRGECYFARGEYLRAAEQFEAVLARFGGGNKAPDALLKIGASHEKLGSSERAREYWERLRRDYPRSDAAKKIPQSNDGSTRGAGPKESR